MNRRLPRLVPIGILAALLAVYFIEVATQDDEGTHLRYSELIARVERSPDSVREVVFEDSGDEVVVDLRDGRRIHSRYPSGASVTRLQEVLEREDVPFDAERGRSSLARFLFPLLLFVGAWALLLGRFGQPTMKDVIERLDAIKELLERERTR